MWLQAQLNDQKYFIKEYWLKMKKKTVPKNIKQISPVYNLKYTTVPI